MTEATKQVINAAKLIIDQHYHPYIINCPCYSCGLHRAITALEAEQVAPEIRCSQKVNVSRLDGREVQCSLAQGHKGVHSFYLTNTPAAPQAGSKKRKNKNESKSK